MKNNQKKFLIPLFFIFCQFIQAQQTPAMYIGAAYYPNRSEKSVIEKDAQLMHQAGFNMVRMGDLVWDLMEPKEGAYDFSWLHTAVDILSKNGVESFLATPTAAIPKWMYDKHPDIMQLTASGERKPFGKRRHACLNHPLYRDYCAKVAMALAHEFKDNPHIIAYQVDNELMAEEPYCYCNYCQKKFSQWLEKKYKTVENLNQAWGLSFWSENLNTFDQAFIPRKGDNPSCFLNYQEFASDCAIDFYNLQRNAIKAEHPTIAVSHNICSSGFLYQLDFYKLSATCDFMSIDNYPYAWTLENEYGNRGAFTFTPHMASMALSQMRGAKPAPFWVTEAQIGRTAGNQRKIVEPGTVRMWSIQELAQGAAGISFFPFKTFSAGHEHVMVGVLDEDNVPRRRYFEAQQVATETTKIKQLTGVTMPVSKVAVIRDFKNDWAFEDGRFSMDFRYMREVFKYYRSLRNASVTTDVISSEASFDNYKMIVIPSMVLINEGVAQKLKAAAEKGTTILITCMTGLRNDDMKSFGRILNSTIEDLAGISIEEQYALLGQENTKVKLLNDTATYSCGNWHDVFKLKTATSIATYDSRFFKGSSAATMNKYGKGTVYYVGAVVDEKLTTKVVQMALQTAVIKPIAVSNNELVEVTEVAGKGGKFLYLLNFSNTVQTVQLTVPMIDVLIEEKFSGTVSIKAMDYKVLKLE